VLTSPEVFAVQFMTNWRHENENDDDDGDHHDHCELAVSSALPASFWPRVHEMSELHSSEKLSRAY